MPLRCIGLTGDGSYMQGIGISGGVLHSQNTQAHTVKENMESFIRIMNTGKTESVFTKPTLDFVLKYIHAHLCLRLTAFKKTHVSPATYPIMQNKLYRFFFSR